MPSFILLEDHPLVLESLLAQLSLRYANPKIVYKGSDVLAAVAAHRDTSATIAIVDLDLGDGRAPADVISLLKALEIPVLVVSALAEPSTVQAVMIAGADGFVSKRAQTSELLDAVESILRGDSFVSPELAGALLARRSQNISLSEQEQRALVLYASGLKLDAVARRMDIAPSTAKSYIDRVREKYRDAGLEARTKTGLYKAARDSGLIS